MVPSANSSQITLPELPGDVLSVDVCFDGTRVWSIDLGAEPLPQDRTVPWPEALVPYLLGSTEVTVVDSGSSLIYGQFPVEFSASSERTLVANDERIPLAINKWGRLGKTLGSGNPGVQERILDRTTEIIEVLIQLGLRPFIVGGTLLGAVREGALLPHDDDADVAYLSEYTNPADVAQEGFAVGHRLQELGYELVRHSATHMQLYFRDDDGGADHYVDVFTAFYTEDGLINQPFHVRGPLAHEQMLPFSTVEISGRPFPAPAAPEAWLTINYDDNWRTPIPGYQLHTPEGTKRRFDAWFGAFHFQRDFWNDLYEADAEAGGLDWQPARDWLLALSKEFTSPTLVDLGAGSGALAAAIQADKPERRVVAADFAHAPSKLASALAAKTGFETAHVNLYRTLSLALPNRLGISGPFDLVASHLFEQTGHLARANALRLVRMALRSGGSAAAVLFGEPAQNLTFEDPTTWHLAHFSLAREAEKLGLGFELSRLPQPSQAAAPVNEPSGELEAVSTRSRYGVQFTLAETPFPAKEESLRQRLKRLFLRARPQSAQEAIQTLTERVAELEQDLDEYRRDSLRVAELMDLAEQRFTPHLSPSDLDIDPSSGQGTPTAAELSACRRETKNN